MLSERGFERVPRRGTFHRLSPEGWIGIDAPITPYSDGAIVVALTAIVRFDAVEQLLALTVRYEEAGIRCRVSSV